MTEKTDPNTDEGDLGKNLGVDAGKTDWEASYKGLQRKLTTLQTQADSWKSERDGAITEIQTLKADLTTAKGQIETFESGKTNLENQVTQLTEQANKATTDLDRAKLILKEFPALAEFEADGLLPQADDATALKEKLTKFQETLKTKVDSGVDKTLDGATLIPDNENPDADLTQDQLYERMMTAAGTGDVQERQRLQGLYDALDK